MDEIILEKDIKTNKILNILYNKLMNYETNDWSSFDSKYCNFLRSFKFNFNTFSKLFLSLYNSCNYKTEIFNQSFDFSSKIVELSNKFNFIIKENSEEFLNFTNIVINSPLHNPKSISKFIFYNFIKNSKKNNKHSSEKESLINIFEFENEFDDENDKDKNSKKIQKTNSNFYGYYCLDFIKLFMFMYQNEEYTNSYINNAKILNKNNKVEIHYIKKDIVQEKINHLNKILKDLKEILSIYDSGNENKNSKENMNKSITKVKYFGKNNINKNDNKENIKKFTNAIIDVIQEVKVKIYRLNIVLNQQKNKSLNSIIIK